MTDDEAVDEMKRMPQHLVKLFCELGSIYANGHSLATGVTRTPEEINELFTKTTTAMTEVALKHINTWPIERVQQSLANRYVKQYCENIDGYLGFYSGTGEYTPDELLQQGMRRIEQFLNESRSDE